LTDVRTRVEHLVGEVLLGFPKAELRGDTVLFREGSRGFADGDTPGDSLDRVEFVMRLEEEFDIEIPDEIGFEHTDTVDGAVAYIESRV
jgi:acyl carrier protein